ncbi:MAG: hypothetical protein HQL10_07615 [Nitrospirae bacterium]|nr:hypothetical protein [Nitrospirota bacterium]
MPDRGTVPVQGSVAMKEYSPTPAFKPDKQSIHADNLSQRQLSEFLRFKNHREKIRSDLRLYLHKWLHFQSISQLVRRLLKYLDSFLKSMPYFGASNHSAGSAGGGGAASPGSNDVLGRGPPAAFSAAALSLMALTSYAEAEQSFDVSAKVYTEAGAISNTKGTLTVGGVSAVVNPVNNPLHFQVDAEKGTVAGMRYNGVAGHAFYKDNNGRLGLFSSYAELGSDVKPALYGLSATKFYNDFHVGGKAGLLNGENIVHKGAFGIGSLKYFFTDNFVLGLEGALFPHSASAKLFSEYKFSKSDIALFASATTGKNNSVIGGLRWYFGTGGKKSLKAEHKTFDNPEVLISLSTLESVVQSANTFKANEIAKQAEELRLQLAAAQNNNNNNNGGGGADPGEGDGGGGIGGGGGGGDPGI